MFKIYYDDQNYEVVEKISNQLKEFGLSIEIIDELSGDGFITYKIVRN
jgi:hypothetical protein